MTQQTLDAPTVDTDVISDTTEMPFDDTGATDKTRTHILNPPKNTHIWREGMEAADITHIARAKGIEVVALCGYTWVPVKNPDKYDVCEECFRIAGEIMNKLGE